jgi:hypothetical protein
LSAADVLPILGFDWLAWTTATSKALRPTTKIVQRSTAFKDKKSGWFVCDHTQNRDGAIIESTPDERQKVVRRPDLGVPVIPCYVT